MTGKRSRVVILTKTVGATSMPWTDLNPNVRRLAPGLTYPPIQSAPAQFGVALKWRDCREQRRRYFRTGLLNAAVLLRSLSRKRDRELVVHVHTPILVVVILFARLIGGRFRVVNTQHNTWPNFRLHQRFCLWILSYVTSTYVGCAEQATESLPKHMRQRLERADRLHTIPNGIPADTMRQYAQQRREYHLGNSNPASAPQTVVIAKMAPQKNGIHLLRLVRQLPELGQVTWYGSGKMLDELRAECSRLGLNERVSFAGVVPREDIYAALVRSDFYLTVSLWEGLSVADLEAVAIGCFPLMSDIPERRVIAEKTGLQLLPAEDVRAWQTQTRSYWAMTIEERTEIGRELSERACDVFSLERMIEAYLKLYVCRREDG
jgi:glycosyltransferase involved in cell wall biosynthesis